MNNTKPKKRLVCVLGLVLMTGTVQAVESNLQFSGALVSEPCNLDPQTSDITVDFQSVVAKYLYLHTRTKGVPFVVNLTNCDMSLADQTVLTFTGTESIALPGQLSVTGAATGVAIGLETPQGVALPFNKPTPAFSLTAGENSLTFTAYVSGEPAAIQNQSITPGDFSATATFSLTYP